jgi:hypothetical protein
MKGASLSVSKHICHVLRTADMFWQMLQNARLSKNILTQPEMRN